MTRRYTEETCAEIRKFLNEVGVELRGIQELISGSDQYGAELPEEGRTHFLTLDVERFIERLEAEEISWKK